MYYPLLFFSELFILFLLSRSVTRLVSAFIYRITGSKRVTIGCIALLFLPGTVLHELSHYITAKLLFVHTYHIEFFPKLDGDNLKLGSVSIAKTDFIRHLLIGMAPFLIGTTFILGILYFAAQNHLFDQPLFIIVIGYCMFEIGNTMFSSKKDMEGAIELLLALALVAAIFYFIGVQLPSFDPAVIFANPLITQAFEKGSLFLLAPIGIDLTLIILLRIFRQ